MNLIEVKNLSLSFDNNVILKNINLNIEKNKITAIIGKNGAGKSTLLKILNNYTKYKYTGNVKYNIDKYDISTLLQISECDKQFPISVFEVVISGLANRKNIFRKYNKEEIKKTHNILQEFNILHLKDCLIKNISGGELQRVLLARCLINDKPLVLLDEPETYLQSHFLIDILKKYVGKKTFVIITHNIDELKEIVDILYKLNTTIERIEI